MLMGAQRMQPPRLKCCFWTTKRRGQGPTETKLRRGVTVAMTREKEEGAVLLDLLHRLSLSVFFVVVLCACVVFVRADVFFVQCSSFSSLFFGSVFLPVLCASVMVHVSMFCSSCNRAHLFCSLVLLSSLRAMELW